MTTFPAKTHAKPLRRGWPALLLAVLLIMACNLGTKRSDASPTTAVTPTQPPPTAMPATLAPTTAVTPTSTDVPPTSIVAAVVPSRPVVSAGAPDGNNLKLFRSRLDFSPDYFLQFYVYLPDDPKEPFKAKKDGKGIASVEFTVTSADGSETYYDRTEKKAGFCIFGGGEPYCNPWILQDGRYRWKSGGNPVKSGKYGLTITVTADDGTQGVWIWGSGSNNPITIRVP